MREENVSLIRNLFFYVLLGSFIVFDYVDEIFFIVKGMLNRVEYMVKMVVVSGELMKLCFIY